MTPIDALITSTLDRASGVFFCTETLAQTRSLGHHHTVLQY
ncbi:MAG: hypothetical protein ACJAR9_000523 [Celeribacter sp.]|jgi:hypothetical protein